jgi:hypothetical protein
MSDKSKTVSQALLAALLLCAFAGTLRAQESYPTPAAIERSEQSAAERERQADEEALADRRQQMIQDCEDNHGSEVDCKRETDTELRAEGLQAGGRVIHLRPALTR